MGTPGLSLCAALSSVPQTQEAGGSLLASFPGPQVSDISQSVFFFFFFGIFVFSPLKGHPVALGRVEGPDCGLAVSALGHRPPRGVCPLHPLAILMLHLLFTFVLLYIGL